MQARPLWTPTSRVDVEPSDGSQLQLRPAAGEKRRMTLVLLVSQERSEVMERLLPAVAVPPSARDTRRRLDWPSPFPLNATSWIS